MFPFFKSSSDTIRKEVLRGDVLGLLSGIFRERMDPSICSFSKNSVNVKDIEKQ